MQLLEVSAVQERFYYTTLAFHFYYWSYIEPSSVKVFIGEDVADL